MVDMTKTILAKSDQLNADDLIGRTITVKVTAVSLAAGEQPIKINYEGDEGKPYYPCKSMRRVLVNTWGADGNAYIGREMTLYRDEKVVFGGAAVGGIRISHMSHIDQPITMSLTAAKASKKPYTVQPLVAAPKVTPEQKKAAAKKKADEIIAAIQKTKTAEEVAEVLRKEADAMQRISNGYSELEKSISDSIAKHSESFKGAA